MPESNGKSNFTAILHRKDADWFDKFNGLTIAVSEYPDRVRYEADCVRHLIGELAETPWITDYDSEKRSGYAEPVRSAATVAPSGAQERQHPDDTAVDRFATAMKAKMEKARAKGRGGWEDKDGCSTERLQAMMADHFAKGDPVDVGNFAMMLFNRDEGTAPSPAIGGPVQDERAAFEHSERASDLTRRKDDYENPYVQSAWDGWQARAALAAKTAPGQQEIQAK